MFEEASFVFREAFFDLQKASSQRKEAAPRLKEYFSPTEEAGLAPQQRHSSIEYPASRREEASFRFTEASSEAQERC